MTNPKLLSTVLATMLSITACSDGKLTQSTAQAALDEWTAAQTKAGHINEGHLKVLTFVESKDGARADVGQDFKYTIKKRGTEFVFPCNRQGEAYFVRQNGRWAVKGIFTGCPDFAGDLAK